MISEVRFQNFKALRDVQTTLGRLTVFVGPNASGKTSVLEGIHYVAQATCNDPVSIFNGPRAPELIRGRQKSERLRFYLGAGESGLSLEIWPESELKLLDRQSFVQPRAQIVSPSDGSEWGFELFARSRFEEKGDWKPWTTVKDETRRPLARCGSVVFLRLDASRLAAPSYVPSGIPRIDSEGDGLASTLLYLKGNDDQAFERIQEELRALVPTVRKIRFTKGKVFRKEVEFLERNGQRTPVNFEREYNGDVLVFDTASGKDIPAHLMSEGTILLLGLLTVLHGPSQPKILLIDDLDRALHPKAQRSLVELLHRWLEARDDLQIAATSHSPYLLDALEPTEVRITALNDNGDVVCAPMNKHPDFAKWRNEMTPGEFWSAVGEDWVREQAHAGAAS